MTAYIKSSHFHLLQLNDKSLCPNAARLSAHSHHNKLCHLVPLQVGERSQEQLWSAPISSHSMRIWRIGRNLHTLQNTWIGRTALQTMNEHSLYGPKIIMHKQICHSRLGLSIYQGLCRLISLSCTHLEVSSRFFCIHTNTFAIQETHCILILCLSKSLISTHLEISLDRRSSWYIELTLQGFDKHRRRQKDILHSFVVPRHILDQYSS